MTINAPTVAKPELIFDSAAAVVTEGDSATRTLVYNFRLSKTYTEDVRVSYVTQNGSANLTDYEPAVGTLVIPAGSLFGHVNVLVNGDTREEGDETVDLVLSNPMNVRLPADASSFPYTGTIRDDDQVLPLTDPAVSTVSGDEELLLNSIGNTGDASDSDSAISNQINNAIANTTYTTNAQVKSGQNASTVLTTIGNAIRAVDRALDKVADAAHQAYEAFDVVQPWIAISRFGIVTNGTVQVGIAGLAVTAVLAPGLIPVIAGVAGAMLVGGAIVATITIGTNGLFSNLQPEEIQSADFLDQPNPGGTVAAGSDGSNVTASAITASALSIGSVAPEPFWQLDQTTNTLTVLKPITPELQTELDAAASRLGILIANPVGFSLQGDQATANQNDVIAGGSGNDNLEGLGGNDTLAARQGNDTLNGGNGNDALDGGPGEDTLVGGAGSDTMYGGTGNDTYFVDNAGDQVSEKVAEGNDTVFATAHFRLTANVEILTLQGGTDLQGYGNALANTINGNTGNNLLDGDAGSDIMSGGAGNDSYFVDNAADQVVENANEGTDTVYSTAHFTLGANIEILVLQGAADLQGNGNGSANTMYGNTGANVLNGMGGADSMLGGNGNDSYFVDNGGDQVVENANEGTDTVYSTVSFVLSSDVEYLILQGGADLQGYGNSLANVIYGNAGANLLDGRGGADSMLGGSGNDSYFVDHAGDSIFEAANEGTDTVYSTAHFTLGSNIETLILQGGADLQGYGNGQANTVYGNSGNNLLDGGGGVDFLTGGGGDDVMVFRVGEANGDVVADFAGNGAAAGDALLFVGYGPGATFTSINASQWQISYNGGANTETINFGNAAAIHMSDYAFI